MPEYRPSNPNFEAKLRDGFAQIPFARYLGIQLAEIRAGAVELWLPFREELGQADRFFQAGAIGSLLDFAGGAACATLIPVHSTLMTLDFTVKIVAPGVGERLIARAEVMRAGQSVLVSTVEVFSTAGGRERLCAVGLVSTKVLEVPERKPRSAATDSAVGAGLRGQP